MPDRIPIHEIALVEPEVRGIEYNGRGRPRLYKPAKVGDRFGDWVVIAYWLPDPRWANRRRICVRCVCGNWRVHYENTIISGMSRSCGHKNRPYGVRPVTGLEVDRTHERRERRRKVLEIMAKVDKIEINIRRLGENRDNHRDASNSNASSSRAGGLVSLAPGQ